MSLKTNGAANLITSIELPLVVTWLEKTYQYFLNSHTILLKYVCLLCELPGAHTHILHTVDSRIRVAVAIRVVVGYWWI